MKECIILKPQIWSRIPHPDEPIAHIFQENGTMAPTLPVLLSLTLPYNADKNRLVSNQLLSLTTLQEMKRLVIYANKLTGYPSVFKFAFPNIEFFSFNNAPQETFKEDPLPSPVRDRKRQHIDLETPNEEPLVSNTKRSKLTE